MKLASVEAIVRALNDANVPFLVVGGVAVVAHGYGRYTNDLDLVVQLDSRSVHAAFNALSTLGYRPLVPVTANGFADPLQRKQWIEDKGMTVLNFHSDRYQETPIDIFVTEPFDFEKEYAESAIREVAHGLSVRILKLDTLLRMKQEAGRPQDLADIAELRQLHKK